MPFASAGSSIASGLSVIVGLESMTSNTRTTLARASCPMLTRAVSIRTGPVSCAR
jgi:hypothetical protein